jgi:hypothetical protein
MNATHPANPIDALKAIEDQHDRLKVRMCHLWDMANLLSCVRLDGAKQINESQFNSLMRVFSQLLEQLKDASDKTQMDIFELREALSDSQAEPG